MDQGTIPIEQLHRELGRDRRTAWLRVVFGVERDQEPALLWHALVVIGPKPDGWVERTWAYPECTFAAGHMSARRIAKLLAPAAQILEVGGRSGSLTLNPGPNVQWFRHPSRQSYANLELPWPSRTVTFTLTEAQVTRPSGYMVGRGVPSFPSLTGAYNAFFDDQWVQTGAAQADLGKLILRTQDGRARVRRVVVRAASLDVWVGGRGVRGRRLELNSSTDRLETVVDKPGKITLPLRTGLGEDPWLWLKDDDDWLDYRSVTSWGGRTSPDVEFEQTEDPVADITALASQGESTYLEYKGSLPGDDLKSKRSSLKTVVAFANGEGGVMLFGVEGDEDVGEIVGLVGKAADLQRRLNELIRDRVSPPPKIQITGQDVDGSYVIRLDVNPGGGVLHALCLDANKPEYYVRRNGSTFYARPEELAQVVRGGDNTASSGIHFFK